MTEPIHQALADEYCAPDAYTTWKVSYNALNL